MNRKRRNLPQGPVAIVPQAFHRLAVHNQGRSRQWLALAPFMVALGLLPMPGQAQTAPATPTTPPANPGGTIQLPQGPPPTGLQAPLPPPALPIPKPDSPAKASPDMSQLTAVLRSQPITLDNAVAIALAVNRSLALSGEALARAQGVTQEARAAFNPTLGSTLSYTHLNQGTSVDIGGTSITIVNADQRQINVQATLPIDILGLLRAATDQAKFLEVGARLDINRTRNEIVSNVKSSFYDVLRTKALVTVATETLRNSIDRYNDAERRFQAGTVARFDVIRAQTDVANGQQALIQARSNVSISIANLNNTIGIDINTPLQISDQGAVENSPGVAPPAVLPDTPNGPVPNPGAGAGAAAPLPTPPPSQPGAVDPTNLMPGSGADGEFDTLNLGTAYESVLKEALELRPEILQSDAYIAANKKGIVLARRSILPSFGLSWGLVYAPDTAGFSPQTTTWQAVASVSLPLYDGGVARARVHQARANVATAETNKRTAVDQVTLDVRQAYLTLLQARNSVAVANQALAQARESFRLARVRYNAGVSSAAGGSPLLEVSDAQNALTQAENNQVNALYTYNNARALLDRAVGRYAYVNNGPGYVAPPPAKTVGAPARGDRK